MILPASDICLKLLCKTRENSCRWDSLPTCIPIWSPENNFYLTFEFNFWKFVKFSKSPNDQHNSILYYITYTYFITFYHLKRMISLSKHSYLAITGWTFLRGSGRRRTHVEPLSMPDVRLQPLGFPLTTIVLAQLCSFEMKWSLFTVHWIFAKF